ncbi:hypothetical protein SynPROSU1_00166 [Synechococcus sp. PROS-U-1]|nr:hypothetical protein SynPROSU1_00166 [Synechococcus sp. PROS-U-1]
MVVSGQLGSDERRNVGVDCRRFDANREPMGALIEADPVDLSTALLAWWERHGRGGIPWKLLPGGGLPAPEQHLDPYGIWIAEVMRCSAA